MEALQVRLLRGRYIEPNDDRPGVPQVVVITQRMANALWPGRDALQQCIEISRRECARVVGVVSDVHRQQLVEEPFLLFFTALEANDSTAVPEALLVRVSGSPTSMISVIRREMLALRPNLPYVRVEPYMDLISPQARSWQLGATIFSAFGVLSLVIAAVGVYGVLSFSVRRRTRELGIRSALGASRGLVLRSVVFGGAAVAVFGVAVGSLAAIGLANRLQPLLFETSAREPLAYAIAGGCILVFALLASLVPGWRATKVDPLVALRME
jgi:hypothetical protein